MVKAAAAKAKCYKTFKRSGKKRTFFQKETVFLEGVCKNNLILITVQATKAGKITEG